MSTAVLVLLSLPENCKLQCENQSYTLHVTDLTEQSSYWPRYLDRRLSNLHDDMHNIASQRFTTQILMYHIIIVILVY